LTGKYCELKRNNKQENNQNKQIVISSIHHLHIQPLEQRIIVCFSFLLPWDTKKKFVCGEYANIIFIQKCTLDRTHIMYCELWSCFKKLSSWIHDTTENCSLDTRTYTQPLLHIKHNLQFIDKFLRDEQIHLCYIVDASNHNM
jgi:hypothetical protein